VSLGTLIRRVFVVFVWGQTAHVFAGLAYISCCAMPIWMVSLEVGLMLLSLYLLTEILADIERFGFKPRKRGTLVYFGQSPLLRLAAKKAAPRSRAVQILWNTASVCGWLLIICSNPSPGSCRLRYHTD